MNKKVRIKIPCNLIAKRLEDTAYWYALARCEGATLGWTNSTPLLSPALMVDKFFGTASRRRVEQATAAFDSLVALGIMYREAGLYRFKGERVESPYVEVPVSVIREIHTAGKAQPGLLGIYCLLMSMRSQESGYKTCSFAQGALGEKYGTTDRTVRNYIQQLEELNLIYVRRQKYDAHSGQRQVNICCAYEDRKAIKTITHYEPGEEAELASIPVPDVPDEEPEMAEDIYSEDWDSHIRVN